MRPRWMLVLAIPLLLAGCYTWSTSTQPVQSVVAKHQGDHLRVKVAGRAMFDLYDARVEGDSLIGTSGAGKRYAVATEDVEYVPVQKTDTVKTGFVMAGVMVAVALLLVALGTAAGAGRPRVVIAQ